MYRRLCLIRVNMELKMIAGPTAGENIAKSAKYLNKKVLNARHR